MTTVLTGIVAVEAGSGDTTPWSGDSSTTVLVNTTNSPGVYGYDTDAAHGGSVGGVNNPIGPQSSVIHDGVIAIKVGSGAGAWQGAYVVIRP